MKYLDLLNRTADETAKTNNSLNAEEQSIAMQQAIFNTKKEASSLAKRLDTLKGASVLDFSAITNCLDAIDVNKRRKSQLTKLQKELF
jgi:hypothetical protein